MTKVQEYIKEAIQEAKKELSGNTIKNCSFSMDMQADGATQLLAEALNNQAIANKASSDAMLKLAESLKPIDACCVKITSDGIEH